MEQKSVFRNWKWWLALPISVPFAFWCVGCERWLPSLTAFIFKANKAGKTLYWRIVGINQPTKDTTHDRD